MDDGTANQVFISKSYDATSHFETTCLVSENYWVLNYNWFVLQDVLDIFKRGTGEDFDFTKVKHTLEDQD